MVAGGWPEVYRHLRSLHQILGKLLWLVLQHGCGGLTLKMGNSDLTDRVLPRWPVPHRMEPETPEGVGRHGLTSAHNSVLSGHIQQDRSCTATGITSLISETLTNMRRDELNLFADSLLEPAACHTCRCM